MRRILLSCAALVVLMLPAAASAGAGGPANGYLVVQRANGDGGVHGRPVVTLVIVQGFVLGRVSQQARVDIYHLPSASGEGKPQAFGADVSQHPLRWRGRPGVEYSGIGFHFRAIDGAYRVVVRGAGVYLFAGGNGSVTLRGSSVYPRSDGKYSIDGESAKSMPANPLTRQIGRG
ncbi:MAG TPA: hypothetical protein VFL58_05585 [Gaiellaceae bacterium]|nr:hypothetical protein [Gaiellaceae bacterium]